MDVTSAGPVGGPARTEGPYLLGVDAGQTVTKAVLFDPSGRAIAMGRAATVVDSPRPRWQERDLDTAWTQAAGAIAECLRSAGVPGSAVAAVGLCGHNDGVYPVDAAGEPVRAAILATDSRAYTYVDRYRTDGVAERALELTGQSPFAGSPAAVYAWLRDHEPEVHHRARWLLFCKDWLRLRLTGEVATDLTEASASFTSVHDQGYSDEALALYGLSDLAAKLPPIRLPGEVAGRVTPAAAAVTGLAAGTPVATGAHDVDAGAIGMGAVDVGVVSLVMGTFSINQVVGDRPVLDHRWQARSFLRRGQWMHMSTSPSSATNLDWAVRRLGLPSVGAAVAAAGSVDSTQVPLYLPFLYGSPHGDGIGAAFADVRGWHEPAHLIRAVLDGVAFNHRTHVDALRSAFSFSGPARISGGGSQSPLWTQLLADTLRLPLETVDTDEAGARGAAVLAGLAAGVYDSLPSAVAATVRVTRRYEVDDARADALDDRYARYRRLVDALLAFSEADPAAR